MLHATKGIVLRTIKYGDTSIIVSVYTEIFGIQSYLVNGVRTEKKSGTKANMYQPATLLDLIVYHQPNKNLQRIKEARLWYSNNSRRISIVKNTIGIYMVELIQKAITEPESNTELYHFFEESFLTVLNSKEKNLADFPIGFTLEFAEHLGFGVQNNYCEETPVFNMQNGMFTIKSDLPLMHHVKPENSKIISNILQKNNEALDITGSKRYEILNICIEFLRLHIPHLGDLKSVPVLHEILN